MFAGVTAARVLAPAVTSLLVALYYKYYKSVAKTDVSHHMSPYPPGGGGGSGGAPPHLQDDRAPPDLDPAVVDKILNVVNAHLDANRNFNNPAVLDEILKLLRNSDPAVLDKVEKLCSGAETETESPDMVQGSRLDHAPSDLDPAILEAIRRIDPGVLDEMLKLGPLILDQIRNQEAVSFPPGGCGGGAPPDLPDDRPPLDLDPAVVDAILTLVNSHLDVNRSFNNPAVLDEIQKLIRNFDPADDIVGKVEKLCLESKTETEQYEQRGGGGGQNESDDGGGGGDVEKAAESWSRTFQCYPVRPEAEDCSFYLKTGTCKFGSNCKFNHPVNRKSNQVPKEREESAENPGQTECKYYLTPGGCKHGKACRYIHSREKPTVAPVVDTNFAGLPIRPGEKECAYYMRHGECKYASNCRFSHPDPVAEGGSDPSSALQGASEATCSAPRSLNETPPCVPMMIPLSPGVASYTREWNGYQSGARSMAARPPYVMNNSMAESNIYKQYPYLNQVEEFPERPGQPVCNHFLRTGDCKFKSSCKYHHPKIQTAVLPSYTHSDKGLPLRPGEKKCPYYMQNGSCKYGLNCKYNHPDPKVAGESDPVSRYGNGGPATFLGASPSTVEPSSARRSLNNTPYVPPMVIPPSQQGPSQNTELNSYQAPANLPEQSMHVPQPYWIDNSMTKTTTYQHPLKKQVEESPERPGRPVCNFFSKTGYCHKSNCNCHHPKYQTSVSPSCELSDKGLPLRPGQNICKQYSSHGICNSGPSCEFDHPPLSTFTL